LVIREAQEELEEIKTRLEAQRLERRQHEQNKTGGWPTLPKELMEKVLEALQAAGRRSEPQEGGLSFSRTSAVVRLVCPGWQAVYDAMVRRLVLRKEITDEAVGMLVRCFPAVTSVQLKGNVIPIPFGCMVTHVGVLAVCSLPALTKLDLSYCYEITDAVLTAIGGMTALKSLNLSCCWNITNVAVLTLSSLPALRHLDLGFGVSITDAEVTAVSGMTALTSLNLFNCIDITNEGVLTLSSLPALTHLDLRGCNNVTAAGVQALRSTTTSPSLSLA